MARETVAQRNARMAAEREARQAQERAEYPARLMLALDRATNSFNYELRVSDGQFVVQDRDAEYDWARERELSYAWDADSMEALWNLERDLEEKAEAKAERERRVAVKKEAERKVREMLSEEERELLGL